MQSDLRLLAGLLAGSATAIVVALMSTFVALSVWPEYAAAAPTKAFTLTMYVARLGVGGICTSIAAVVTTRVVSDDGRAARWLGGLFLAICLPIHLHYVWNDYPGWYHILFLSYLVPVAGLTGWLVSRNHACILNLRNSAHHVS